jgi:hypothetical protein
LERTPLFNSVNAPAAIVDNVTDFHSVNLDGTPITSGVLVYPTSPVKRTVLSYDGIGVGPTSDTDPTPAYTYGCVPTLNTGYYGTITSEPIDWVAPFKVN